MSISWYYVWSDQYRLFHEILQDKVRDPTFILKPIKIDNEENISKIDLLINILKNSSDSYILFTDIDLIIKDSMYKNIKKYIANNQTQVFLDENTNISLGLILLKVCPEVLDFWVSLKAIERSSSDQILVNDLIHTYKGKWTRFNSQEFTSSSIWNGKQEFSVMKPLSSCLGKEFDFAEKIFITAQHIDIEEYMKYVDPNIIPYIYKFQEILFKSHQLAKSNAVIS